jgi:hypothetical protein
LPSARLARGARDATLSPIAIPTHPPQAAPVFSTSSVTSSVSSVPARKATTPEPRRCAPCPPPAPTAAPRLRPPTPAPLPAPRSPLPARARARAHAAAPRHRRSRPARACGCNAPAGASGRTPSGERRRAHQRPVGLARDGGRGRRAARSRDRRSRAPRPGCNRPTDPGNSHKGDVSPPRLPPLSPRASAASHRPAPRARSQIPPRAPLPTPTHLAGGALQRRLSTPPPPLPPPPLPSLSPPTYDRYGRVIRSQSRRRAPICGAVSVGRGPCLAQQL